MSSGSANKVNSPEDPDFAGVEGGEPVTAATSDRFSSKTSSKVSPDGVFCLFYCFVRYSDHHATDRSILT
jgi:hypothetical protein